MRPALVLAFTSVAAAQAPLSAQPVNSSSGTEFWLGFMQNYGGNPDATLELVITSDQNTSGTVEIPSAGFSEPFTVLANSATTVSLPVAMAMHLGSDSVEHKGIHVASASPVSVFAFNIESYTSDGTSVYPVPALGTDYRVVAYQGLDGFAELTSEFLIVSTADDTEVEVITTANTQGGHIADVIFTVVLDEGESYQVKAASPSDDLTGTLIRSSDSGPCRPIAVFAGAVCTNVPVGCTACDHLFEQMLPAERWGTVYHAVPFSTTTSYSFRALAVYDSTTLTINGGPPVLLHAGDRLDSSMVATEVCLEADQAFIAAQYMQGVTCSGNGDPSMMLLNASTSQVDHITFGTSTSPILTDHYLNLIIDSADVGNVEINGLPVSPVVFDPFISCPSFHFATFPLSVGTYTIECSGGLIAYIYGMGSAESYAFSLGSTSDPALVGDSLICVSSGTTVILTAPAGMSDPIWTSPSDPLDTLSTDVTFVVTVDSAATFLVTEAGGDLCTGFTYHIGTFDPFGVAIYQDSLSVDTLWICSGAQQLVQAIVPGDPDVYGFFWQPNTGVVDLGGGQALVSLDVGGTAYVTALLEPGCSFAMDSVVVVEDSSFTVTSSPDTTVCGPVSIVALMSSSIGGTASTYAWTTDLGNVAQPDSANTNVIVTTTSEFIVTVTSTEGCTATDTTLITVLPPPPIPWVAPVGGTLSGPPGYASYQWLLNGIEIIGATSQTIVPPVNGFYSVVVTDANGCSSTSPYYNFLNAGIEGWPVSNVSITIVGSAIVVSDPGGELDEATVISTLGQTIAHWRPGAGGERSGEFMVGSSGVYLVLLRSGGRSITKRVVVLNDGLP